MMSRSAARGIGCRIGFIRILQLSFPREHSLSLSLSLYLSLWRLVRCSDDPQI